MSNENNALAKGDGHNKQWLPPFSLLNGAGTSVFSVDINGNVTAAGTLTGSGQVDSSGNATFAGTFAATGDATFAGNVTLTGSGKKLDLTAIGAANPALKFAATSDTPTVAFTDNGTAAHAPTTAPAGYLKVLVGASSRYIPFWA